jgi:hypothetical protein
MLLPIRLNMNTKKQRSLAYCKNSLIIIPLWNIEAEVKQQNARLAKLGTKFVTAVPQPKIV